jgi:multiple sugar transport system permease protein
MGKVGVMKKPVTLSSRVARAGTLMVLPSLCIIAVFVLYPIADSFWMSLHNWNILKNTKSFLGLSNYMQAFHDERFLNALKNTVVYTITYVPILVVSSLLIAVFLNYGFSGAGFFKSLFFLPSITSMAIIAIVFRFLLDGDIGWFSLFLQRLGFRSMDILRTPSTAMIAVVLVGVWRWMGFNMVILLSGLNSVPESLYEAAEMDGAGKVRQFFSISLPLIVPILGFTLITNIISSFQAFDQIYVMTKGGPMFSTEVLVYYIYYRGFNVFDMGYASAMAFILFCIILVFTLLQLRGFGKKETEGGIA